MSDRLRLSTEMYGACRDGLEEKEDVESRRRTGRVSMRNMSMNPVISERPATL